MASPNKKRKLNSDAKPVRGLEYFFARQRETTAVGASPAAPAPAAQPLSDVESRPEATTLSDEELARKLQAEWDAEVAEERASRVAGPRPPESNPAAATPPPPQSPRPLQPKSTILSLQSVSSIKDSVTDTLPLDESPLTFDPSHHLPHLRRQWTSEASDGTDNGHASYALLTRCFVLVNATSSRIKIVDTLVNCVRLLVEGDPASLVPAVWLATNAIAPPYVSLELGLGGSAIGKALKRTCGLSDKALRKLYNRHGDAGDVAFEAKRAQAVTLRKPKPLTIRGVYEALVKIARSQGQGSVEAKQRIVDRLLQDARGGEESRYVVRTLCQHLRIGAVKTTMLIALSRALLLSRPPSAGPDFAHRSPSSLAGLEKEKLTEIFQRAEELVKACFARRPDYNHLVPSLLDLGVSDALLQACDLTPHVPLRPMLGSITRDLSEMLERLRGRAFACEWKYDGQRAQVHRGPDGKVSIFSRHLELMTDKYPDLVALMDDVCGEGVESFALEGEVVAVEKDTGALKSFQTLTNRARKDVDIGSVKVDVCLFAFDLMYLDGVPLLDRPFRERRELLRTRFVEVPFRFTWVRSLDAVSADSEAVLDFFKLATENKCEGIMVKVLDNLEDVPAPEGEETIEKAKSKPNTTSKRKGKSMGKDAATEEQKPKSRRKPLLATYEPDKRLDSWLKVKKDYTSSSDTLDLVPVAAWHGQGRKAKWWSPILLAARNEAAGTLEAVCKCISGFTDAFYKENRGFYDIGDGEGGDEDEDEGEDEDGESRDDKSKDGVGPNSEGESIAKRQNVRNSQPGFVTYTGPQPDVWFEPQEVWEVAFADITQSPTYLAGREVLGGDRGLSLRFPRFMRKRADKAVEDASTDEFLVRLWEKQEARGQVEKGVAVEEDKGGTFRSGDEDGEDGEDVLEDDGV